MNVLSTQERAKRLAEYIRTITGDKPDESIINEIAPSSGLEAIPDPKATRAVDTVVKSLGGGAPSLEALIETEAIIHKTTRPSHLVQDGWFQPFSGEFSYLTSREQTSAALHKAIPAVGRIDLPNRPTTYGGTGFVVGKNIVMTNRHVAEIFTTGVGRANVTIKPWEPGEVDFKKEYSVSSRGFALTRCIMVHPYWDVALFQADLPDNIEPLEMSVEPPGALLNRDIVVLGYPAFDPDRNDVDVQQQIFEGKYNVKRISPGRIVMRKQPIKSAWLTDPVAAIAHDSSTLGGNSGSAVFDPMSGRITGLHFAGRYLIENYAVPGYELARDPRVVDAGVRFSQPIPSPNVALEKYWSNAGGELLGEGLRQSNGHSQRCNTLKAGTPTRAPSADGTVIWEVPLRFCVSLGGAMSIPPVMVRPAQEDEASETEAPATGYSAVFLSRNVPLPEFSEAISNDAFVLDGSHWLHYTHFSVSQSMSRALPRIVAWNIDGNALKSISRNGLKFKLDQRVPSQFQVGDDLYSNNPFDRGHIARRADLTWGTLAEAKRANTDSFFFTNITPQHEAFNQSSKHGLWGELENAILGEVDVEGLRVSVMAGPVFKQSDPTFRGVKIPREFWKLIAFRDTADNLFKVSAYVLTQEELVPTEALELDPFKLYQVALSKLAQRSALRFDALLEFDTMDGADESTAGSGVRSIHQRSEVVV